MQDGSHEAAEESLFKMPDKEPIVAYMALCDHDSTILGLSFGENKVSPKQHIPKGEAKLAPELAFNGSAESYIVLMFDLDAPFLLGFMTPILHWGQTGLKVTKDGTGKLEAGNAPFIADYAPPAPPPGSNPHRYVFLLYEQPKGFNVGKWAAPGQDKVGVRPRARYDLKAFEKAAGLGSAVACNYFLCN